MTHEQIAGHGYVEGRMEEQKIAVVQVNCTVEIV